MLAVKAAIDAMEGRKIGYRTYRSLRERYKGGYSAGGRIYGYTSVEDGDYRRRVVDEEQAAIVREIFERYAAGEGAKTIARDLNARGIPSPGSYWNNRVRRADGWVHTTLAGAHTKASGILRNPIYTGRHTWNKRKGKKRPGTAQRVQTRRPDAEWIESYDESLRVVPDDLWNGVQARLQASRRGSSGRGRPNRYLLSGVLKCASCGGSYVMANDRNYRCSSHTNGRDSICGQRRIVNRRKAEDRLLAGIKSELSTPKVIKEMARQVRARLRDMDRPDTAALKAELAGIERKIDNVVDTLSTVGRSEALTARLQKLESEKARIVADLSSSERPPRLVPNVERLLRARIDTIEQLPRDSLADAGLAEKARAAVQALIGRVSVVEDGDAVYAEVDFGRAYINHGAEKRT